MSANAILQNASALPSHIVASKDAMPKDAAAVVLIRQHAGSSDGANARSKRNADDAPTAKVFWARRSGRLVFLAGFYAFPGGVREQADALVTVANCDDAQLSAMIVCAARELFEETCVLAARGAERLTKGQRASLLDDLESGRYTFPALLAHYDLHLDARDFVFVARHVTPAFSSRRYDTWFFVVNCPAKQEPLLAADGELQAGEWVEPQTALARWREGRALIAPPVRLVLEELSDERRVSTDESATENEFAMSARVNETETHVRAIEFIPDFVCFPVRTPTLPPATHTNCYVIGGREFVIIDPASPDEAEQAALAAFVDDLLRAGKVLREIILTHHHGDHIGGAAALLSHLETKHGVRVAVAAHRLTAEILSQQSSDFRVTRAIEDGCMIDLAGAVAPLALRALHTPGHTRGHLCFYEERTGALITGDMIVGIGSVLIAPPEGDMRDYLDSLRRLRALPHLTILLGGHGPAAGNPRHKIAEYIAHRLERERSIIAAMRDGADTVSKIVSCVYTDVPPQAHALAAHSVRAHLDKLEAENTVRRLATGEGESWVIVVSED